MSYVKKITKTFDLGKPGGDGAPSDPITYTTEIFPASEGLRVARRLARLVSNDAVAMALLQAPEETGGDDSVTFSELFQNPAVMASFIIGAAEKSGEDDWPELCKDLLKKTTCDRCRIGDAEVPGPVLPNFDGHFAGRYMHLLEVMFWAMRAGFVGP